MVVGSFIMSCNLISFCSDSGQGEYNYLHHHRVLFSLCPRHQACQAMIMSHTPPSGRPQTGAALHWLLADGPGISDFLCFNCRLHRVFSEYMNYVHLAGATGKRCYSCFYVGMYLSRVLQMCTFPLHLPRCLILPVFTITLKLFFLRLWHILNVQYLYVRVIHIHLGLYPLCTHRSHFTLH